MSASAEYAPTLSVEVTTGNRYSTLQNSGVIYLEILRTSLSLVHVRRILTIDWPSCATWVCRTPCKFDVWDCHKRYCGSFTTLAKRHIWWERQTRWGEVDKKLSN